jgi:hypothetical protein
LLAPGPARRRGERHGLAHGGRMKFRGPGSGGPVAVATRP